MLAGLLPIADDVNPYAWDFSIGVPWSDPIFYINGAGLVLAIMLLMKLRDRRGESSLADGAWWGSVVFLVGTGSHFLLDLMNFPEQDDHILIHVTVGVALFVLLWFARRGD
ncbi:MAG: hypothetical protein ACYDBQ_05215 [Thermoplasmatota archaeon]